MAPQEPPLARMTERRRKGLQILSVLLILIGGALFAIMGYTMVSSFGAGMGDQGGGSGWFDEMIARMGVSLVLGAVALALLTVGGVLALFAFLGPVAGLMATETAGATQHTYGAVGRGLSSGGFGMSGPSEVVRLRCRGCGFLDTEDARFCSSCGEAV